MNFCRILLAAGADVDRQSNIGYSSIHYAVLAGHTHVLQSLLDFGANPQLVIQAKDSINSKHDGLSPLLLAVDSGNLTILKCIVERLSAENDIHKPDSLGNSPFVRSIQSNQLDIAEYLLLSGANANDVLFDETVSVCHNELSSCCRVPPGVSYCIQFLHKAMM